MPYTFAHIGYNLPFKKKWSDYFSTTGLVFGSIAPDYDILFRLTKVRFHLFQYDIKSILLYIYPLAFLSAIAFHLLCRNVLIEHLPEYYKNKCMKFTHINFIAVVRKHFLKISGSIIFAIMLHLLLDLLCHSLNAYYVQEYFLLLTRSEFLAHVSYLGAIYLLPVLFSIAGFMLIWKYAIKKFSMRDISLSPDKRMFWIVLILTTIIITLLKIFISETDHDFLIDYVVISITSSFMVSVYIVCTIYFFAGKTKANSLL